jgi:hypothetical protein
MLTWIQSWTRTTWVIAWAMLVLSVVALVLLFGPDRIAGWVEGVWRARQ